MTGWDPPRRFVYEEPEWAELAGHPDASVSPLATEFLVEARSGGTCVVRVTSSAFGTGADWENEFIDEMATYFRPFFDLLRCTSSASPASTPPGARCGSTSPDGLDPADVVPGRRPQPARRRPRRARSTRPAPSGCPAP